MGLGERLMHAWNAFTSRDPTSQNLYTVGPGSYYMPDRRRLRLGNEFSQINAIYNRISVDVAALSFQHARLDAEGRYSETVKDGLNECLTMSANIDQTGRMLVQDIVTTMLDKGAVAIVPVETKLSPFKTDSFDILQLRAGEITEWFPKDVRISLYNEEKGQREDVILPKRMVAIVENTFYTTMNSPNSIMQRLIYKLNMLDAVDEQSSSGKLDLIVQLPYVVKSEGRKKDAERRRKDIEDQLAGSKYGIAYIDGTEKVTQLNRSLENNLLTQIQYLTSMLYSQLGMPQSVFDGTADEKTMLNYNNRTIEPIVSAITNSLTRTFLTKTARTQGHAVVFFNDPFKLVPVSQLAEIADKFTRNEILSSNEIRQIIGRKPSDDPNADQLRNKNLNQQSPAPQEIQNGGQMLDPMMKGEEENAEREV